LGSIIGERLLLGLDWLRRRCGRDKG
jgi:hypothetical protein